MDTSTLRWILIIIGVIIVASIFLFGNPEKRRSPKASRKAMNRERREPTMDSPPTDAHHGTVDESDAPAGADEAFGQGELDIGQVEPPAQTPAPSPPPETMGPPPEKIISLFLLARDNHVVSGAELLQAAVSTGMEFGAMNIFHRLPEGSDQAVFSLANAAKPGHFDRDGWNTFETTGVVLFMTLPGPVYPLDAWDSMLATARRMGEILNAELLDEGRKPFTRQKEAQIREEIRGYDRQKS